MSSEAKRFSKKVPGGVMIEDDGGFMNFFPTPAPTAGHICIGIEDNEVESPAQPNADNSVPDNVIYLHEWKAKKGIK